MEQDGGLSAFARLLPACRVHGTRGSRGTPGAAHAVARFGAADNAIVPAGRTVEALSGLPVAALRLAGTALIAAEVLSILNRPFVAEPMP